MNAKLEPFHNRLAKNRKHLGKWARRVGVQCYRLYDNDIPGTPLAIDLYENLVHVSEYERNHGMEEAEHAQWLADCLEIISAVLEVHTDSIYLKFRQRQKGSQQYNRFARQGGEFIVRENGLKFIINPSDYLDVGLFLDHRITRQMVRENAEGKKVLNLFAYTGSFSVYAAAGGASETLTVDMSNTYLQWADRNLVLNGFDGENHKLLQADVLQWLKDPTDRDFDLIVIDPPTFSNSKRMEGTLDTQRDHVWIINQALMICAPGAEIWFSTNYRKFKLDDSGIKSENIQDITKQTIPPDFRNDKVHYCYRIFAR